jgi:hypothetical protein
MRYCESSGVLTNAFRTIKVSSSLDGEDGEDDEDDENGGD